MYPTSFNPPDPAPLDFNTPPRTDPVADTLVSEPASHNGACAPAAESLLAEIGLPAHRVRQVLAEARASNSQE